MGFVSETLEAAPQLKPVVYTMLAVIWIACPILVYVDSHRYNVEFSPYSGKVTSFYTETHKQGGVLYQCINFDCNHCLVANAFSAVINGRKTKLIDYIAVGDSVVCDTEKTAIVYRKGAETYKFTHHASDFK